MNKFIEVLEKMTGKKVIRPRASVSHDGKVGRGELRKLAGQIRKWKWEGMRFLKKGKKLDMVTTNDLDEEGKLKPDYLEKRAHRNRVRRVGYEVKATNSQTLN